MAQQAPLEYVRHGQTPFFRLPLAGSSLAPARPAAVFLGVPFDGGTTCQPGARLAPWHVRRVSALVQTYHPIHRVDVFGRVPSVDGGNVVFPPFDPAAMRAAVEADASGVLSNGSVPFVVGGDHSITLPVLRAMAARHGPVAVVHVDAHLDTSGPDQLFHVGMIRGPMSGTAEATFSEDHGAVVFSAESVAERGVPVIAAEIRQAIGPALLYLTVDVDWVGLTSRPTSSSRGWRSWRSTGTGGGRARGGGGFRE
jgi:agmatinase